MIICPICENSDEKLIKNSFLSKFRYCTTCGGHFLVGEDFASYPEEYFFETSEPSLIAKMTVPILSFFYKLRVNKIKKLLKNKSNPKVLDYGCGSGNLVEILIKRGIETVGFEPSVGARLIAERKNLPVYGEMKPTEDGYDLIMFWHSLEHTSNPLEVISKAKEYLNENSKLLIAVPNADSFEARIFKENWFHYSYPFHLIHFTQKSVKIMLRKTGFYPTSIDFWNPEYTISGLVQSFLNWFLPKDVLYSVVGHRRQSMSLSKAIFWASASLILFIIFSPILILFFLIELIFHKTGAMVVVAEKLQKYEN